MCLSDTYCPFFSPLRVLFLHLLIELMQPSVLCLVATHAFVPERRKLLLTTQCGILLLDTVLPGINPLSDPSERLRGPMLYVPRCFLEFLVLPLQHPLFLDTIREIFVELPPIRLQIRNLLLFCADKGLVLDEFLLCAHVLLLGHAVLITEETILLVELLQSLLETQLLIEACIVTRTGERVHAGFQVLDLRLQDLILGHKFIDLFSLLRCLLERDYVFLDCSELLDPKLRLIELSLDLPELPLGGLKLLPQLLVLQNQLLDQLMLILKLLHVHRTQLRVVVLIVIVLDALSVTDNTIVVTVLIFLIIFVIVERLSVVLQVDDTGLMAGVLGVSGSKGVRVEVVTATATVVDGVVVVSGTWLV